MKAVKCKKMLKMDVRLSDVVVLNNVEASERKRQGETEKDGTVKMNYGTFLSSPALWLLRPSSHGDHARQTAADFAKGEKNNVRPNKNGRLWQQIGDDLKSRLLCGGHCLF